MSDTVAPPPDWYLRHVQRLALQGLPAGLPPCPDPLVRPEDVQAAQELRQAGRLN
jgi:hypothetical protein